MNHRRSLLPVFLTYFLDNFGLAIVYPIFTPLFLKFEHAVISPSLPVSEKTFLLGIIIAAFPLAQFFGAPLIGEFSDIYGRKKSFYLTILGTGIGYMLTAVGIEINNYELLLFSRLLTGFFAGNLTLCLASVADMSPDETSRVKNFSLVAVVGGTSFVLAILLGGLFANSSWGQKIDPSLPFWATASLSLVNVVLMGWLFKESHPGRRPKATIHPLKGVHNILSAIKSPNLRVIYSVYFFFTASWVVSMQFLPAYIIETFPESTDRIPWIFMSVGILWSLVNLVVNRVIAKRMYPARTLLYSLGILSVTLAFGTFVHPLVIFLTFFLLSVMLAALCWTNSLATASLTASRQMQGSILGINQSISSIATMVGPGLLGFVIGMDPRGVYIFASGSVLIAFTILYFNRNRFYTVIPNIRNQM